MRIICLIEDAPVSNGCVSEHGLSFYIETSDSKFMFDTGQSSKTWQNARFLGINPEDIDFVVLSHGHYDHTGGLETFFTYNHHAPAYLQHTGIYSYYNQKPEGIKYIGMAPCLKEHPQLCLLNGMFSPAKDVSLFGQVTERIFWPRGNLSLKRGVDELFIQDCFDHEQYAVIFENEKRILIGGCAHAGIVNILRRFEETYGGTPDAVISGFHMMKTTAYDEKDFQIIRETADMLKCYRTHFYTGHCTGDLAFEILREKMGEQLQRFTGGTEIIL